MDNSLSCFSLSMAAATAVLATGLWADVLEVGEGKAYADIQSAIDAAVEGQDEVLIHDGTYEITDSLVLEKGITLRSVNGADATIVTNTFVVPKAPNKQEVHRCIVISNENAVVEGITFAGGYLFDKGTNPSDLLQKFGAGVYLASGRLLSSKVVRCHMGQSNSGGSLALMSMKASVSNCVISANESMPDGYGYQVLGVGVYAIAGELVDSEICDNIYRGNTYPRGAGCHVADSGDNAITFTMRRCKIMRNVCLKGTYVSYWGASAGLYCAGRNSLYENLLIADNSTAVNGGGVWLGFSNYTPHKFVNCTIVNNTAAYGGGVQDQNGYGRFYNCLIQGNKVTGDDSTALKPEVIGGQYYHCLSPVDLNTRTAAGGNDVGTATFKPNSYELAAGSLAYNAGDVGTFTWLETTTDLNGDARIWKKDEGGIIDIGCYEYSSSGFEISIAKSRDDKEFIEGTKVVYTAKTIPEDGDYTYEWTIDGEPVSADAVFEKTFDELGSHMVALTVTDASAGAKTAEPEAVWVQPKTLYVVCAENHPGHQSVEPFNTKSGAATNIADAVAAAGNGSAIYIEPGSYVIDEQIVVEKGVSLLAGADKSVTVVRPRKKNTRLLDLNHQDAVVSGVTFSGAYFNIDAFTGGGVQIRGGGGTMTNCTVSGCAFDAVQQLFGAGVSMSNGLLVDCDILCNTNSPNDSAYLQSAGAGIDLKGGEVRRCRIVGNVMKTRNGNANHCQHGGGIFAKGGKVINCLVADNSSNGGGGGMYFKSSAVVSNCTFAGNSAYSGAAIGAEAVSTVCNSAFAGNTSEGGGQISSVANSAFTYCFGPKDDLPEGEGNVFGTDAKFKNAKYVPYASSPLFDNGVFADWMVEAKDLRGNPRVTERGKVTIGCYQVEPTGLMLLVR